MVVHKDIFNMNKNEMCYLLLRERGKRGGQYKYFPAVKFLKFNKGLIKKIVNLKIGDILNIKGALTIVTAIIKVDGIPEGQIKTQKMVVNIQDLEVVDHLSGLEDVKLERFINIENDGFIKSLSVEELERMEKILDKKLEMN